MTATAVGIVVVDAAAAAVAAAGTGCVALALPIAPMLDSMLDPLLFLKQNKTVSVMNLNTVPGQVQTHE